MGAAIVMAASLARAGNAQVATRPLGVGHRAPGAPVKTLDGASANLGHYLGSGPVVIEFWGKWCPNCRELEPRMQAARDAFGSRVRFVTIAVSVDETPAEVAAYTTTHGFSPDVVYDETGAAVDAYGAPGTSYVVVVDRSRRIVYTGAGPDQDLVAAVKRAQ
jgi:thiol-disulfide isomerase/thioredoxin